MGRTLTLTLTLTPTRTRTRTRTRTLTPTPTRYGYTRIELWPAELGVKFEKGLYERMLSCLYEDPQYLAALLRRSDPKEVDLMVDIITQRLYSNHYKARHTPYP